MLLSNVENAKPLIIFGFYVIESPGLVVIGSKSRIKSFNGKWKILEANMINNSVPAVYLIPTINVMTPYTDSVVIFGV